MYTYTLNTHSWYSTQSLYCKANNSYTNDCAIGLEAGLLIQLDLLPPCQLKPQHSSHFNLLSSNNSSPYYSLINDVDNTSSNCNPETSIITGVTLDLANPKTVLNHTNFPLFQSASNTIKIPSKVEYSIRRLISKKELKKIHPTIEVAVELCLLFISNLTSTYFGWKDGSNLEGWKPLKAAYLRKFISYEKHTYKLIRELLEKPLRDGAIIECDYYDIQGAKCYYYRLGSNYIGKGIKTYQLKTNLAIELNQQYYDARLRESKSNPICNNLFQVYAKITLPTIEDIKVNAKKLVASGYKSKKGKKLTFLNKHSKQYFSDASERTFVEFGIQAFEFLTGGGFMLPRISSEYAGGRVVDSFVLMPSYIRNMCKIDGQPAVEVDFSCLHPNIAMFLYGGKQRFITHQMIADELGIPLSQVKTEHLSFFNKHPEEMKDSPLYSYYMKKEPAMMKNLIKEKYAASRRHKITSQKMFEKEVAIMTDTVKQLSLEGILVLYVYDALLCTPNNAARVKQVMDEQVLKHGVFTVAKINTP